MPAAEPRYVRLLRGLLHLTEPETMDGILLGFAVGVLLVLVPVLYFIS